MLDERTIRFRTHDTDVIWPRRALQVVIADPEEAQEDGFGACPSPGAGSGLFQITEFVPNGILRLERVEGSWRGTAQVKALEMRPYDPQALESALLSGDAADFGYLTEEQVDRLDTADLVLQRVLQSNVHTLRFNSLRPPFDDPRLREAVSLAVDQTRIVDEEYRGRGRAPNQLVGTGVLRL